MFDCDDDVCLVSPLQPKPARRVSSDDLPRVVITSGDQRDKRNSRRRTIDLNTAPLDMSETAFVNNLVNLLAKIKTGLTPATKKVVEEILYQVVHQRSVSPEHFEPVIVLNSQFEKVLRVPPTQNDRMEVTLTSKSFTKTKVCKLDDQVVDLLQFDDVNFDDESIYPLSVSFNEVQ